MEQVSTTQLSAGCRGQAVVLDLENLESAFDLHRLRIFRFILVSLRDRAAETWLMRIAVNLVRDHVRSRRIQFWRRSTAVSGSASEIAAWLPDGRVSPETGALLKQQVTAVFAAAPRRDRSRQQLRRLPFRSTELRNLARPVPSLGSRAGAGHSSPYLPAGPSSARFRPLWQAAALALLLITGWRCNTSGMNRFRRVRRRPTTRCSNGSTSKFLVVSVLALSPLLAAQGPGFGDRQHPGDGPPPMRPMHRPMDRAMHAGPGRWWSDPRVAEELGLSADQQHRMDDLACVAS